MVYFTKGSKLNVELYQGIYILLKLLNYTQNDLNYLVSNSYLYLLLDLNYDTHIMYSSVFYYIYQLVIFYRWSGEVSLWCFAWRY
jgi:hypothetical protein